MVRRLICVEDKLCSNHNNPNIVYGISIIKYMISNIAFDHNNDLKYIKKLLWNLSYVLKRIIYIYRILIL